MPYLAQLPLSKQKISRCKKVARNIGKQVATLVRENSTVGVERGVLRLLGMNEAVQKDELLYPIANLVVDQLQESQRLPEGALYWVANAMLDTGLELGELEQQIGSGKLNMGEVPPHKRAKVIALAKKLAKQAVKELKHNHRIREKVKRDQKDPLKQKRPLKYVIVATGNIFEDVTQARAAAQDGADVIAVIRSTAQSLLDYVPQGTTTVGFGGTYATQGNFKVMREALDEVGHKHQRYIRLTNYASGLCMAEITALAAREGLDCLLNDAMYGILFRDINMVRTLVDQHFSRLICGNSGIWIMSGEDNYMKTTDAVESGDSVLASQFINVQTALNAGMSLEQMSIGHAMEMNPKYDNVILMEIARAQMTRQIFPHCPLKYMCNTKYKTGEIFTSHAIDTIFNLIGSLTSQGVLLLGMLTEAVHTPFLHDRSMSIRSANYVVNGMLKAEGEFGYKSDGFISKFSQKVLDDAVKFLEKAEKMGFLNAIEKGYFAGVRRPKDGGKGADGVFPIDPERYFNPFYELLGSEI